MTPENVGTFELNCFVTQHLLAGATALYTVTGVEEVPDTKDSMTLTYFNSKRPCRSILHCSGRCYLGLHSFWIR